MIEKDLIIIHDLIDRYIAKHQEALSGEIKFPNLSNIQKRTLKWIEKQTHPVAEDLAFAFNKTFAEVNEALHGLSGYGLVMLQPATNGQKTGPTIQLTPSGKKVVQVEEEAIMEFSSQVRSVLSEKELKEIDFLLSKVITRIG